MEILHLRRSSEHKELQKSTLAIVIKLQLAAAPSPHRHTASKQPNGALVTHAFSNATRVLVASRVPALVLQSIEVDDRRKPRIQRATH